MYLWHFPLFVWVDPGRTGLSGYRLFGLRLAITLVVASASFFVLEQPIRRGAFFRHWRARIGTPVAVGGVAVFVVLATTSTGIAAPVVSTAPAQRTEGRVVMVLGDSTALTLGFDLSIDEKAHHATIVDEGIVGCDVAEVREVETESDNQPLKTAEACNLASPLGERWPALWRKWVREYDPSVVVILAGRWEVSDVEWQGSWTNILHHSFARYVLAQLGRAVRIASSTGAHVDLLTAPCYSTTTSKRQGRHRSTRRAVWRTTTTWSDRLPQPTRPR